MLSYCTNSHQRMWQLVQTIDHNLSFTQVNEIELCVLAYNDDEAEPYLRERYLDHITVGRLKVKTHWDDYVPLDGSAYACGYVKNLNHAMATGKILFNLDVDNFIGDTQSQLLALKPNVIMKNIAILDGRSGRIGIHRTLFDKVGGYRDVGRNDDGDFVRRCLMAGAHLIHTDCSIPPINNDRATL